MRYVPVLLLLQCFCVHAQENLSLGQDRNIYLQQYPPKYKTVGPTIINFPEGTIDFYKYKTETADEDIKILVILDKYPVGVLQSNRGESQFYYDLSGDGILDSEVATMEVPFWVVASNTDDTLKTENNNIKPYLDTFYQLFQNDENPYTSGKYIKNSNKLLDESTSLSLENRDLFYSLFCYYRWGNKYPAGAIAAIDYLASQYVDRFNADHPLFRLHFLESLINLGQEQQAMPFLESLLLMDPSFVPAQVYRWQLEKDPQQKKKCYEELKKQHPKHWIVRQI
jgi:hypothetical protein